MTNNRFIDRILTTELQSYFIAHPEQYDELRQIITNQRGNKKTLPSLRGLEYVTTHMAKVDNLCFVYEKNGEQKECNIYHEYKTKLGSDKKAHFDSFRRTSEIQFAIPGKQPIQTTVAQLQWGRWIYEHCIMPYVKDNWPRIRKRMAESLKDQRNSKRQKLVAKKCVKQSVGVNKITINW